MECCCQDNMIEKKCWAFCFCYQNKLLTSHRQTKWSKY